MGHGFEAHTQGPSSVFAALGTDPLQRIRGWYG